MDTFSDDVAWLNNQQTISRRLIVQSAARPHQMFFNLALHGDISISRRFRRPQSARHFKRNIKSVTPDYFSNTFQYDFYFLNKSSYIKVRKSFKCAHYFQLESERSVERAAVTRKSGKVEGSIQLVRRWKRYGDPVESNDSRLFLRGFIHRHISRRDISRLCDLTRACGRTNARRTFHRSIFPADRISDDNSKAPSSPEKIALRKDAIC